MTRAVVQRVRRASVCVDGEVVSAIDRGLLILLGIRRGDTAADARRVADKLAVLRVFEDSAGKMNLSVADVGGAMLVVSQFTLYGDIRKGRRPSFVTAEEPGRGQALYDLFCARLAASGRPVQRGRFGARMLVSLENDGPVTILLDSEDL